MNSNICKNKLMNSNNGQNLNEEQQMPKQTNEQQ